MAAADQDAVPHALERAGGRLTGRDEEVAALRAFWTTGRQVRRGCSSCAARTAPAPACWRPTWRGTSRLKGPP